MSLFSPRNIREKLLGMNLISIGVAFLLTMLLVLGREVMNFKRFVEQDLTAQAKIIGNSCTAALSFNDEKAAEETLSSLKDIPDVTQGIIYTREWKVFAKYVKATTTFLAPEELKVRGFSVTRDSISLFEPIYWKDELVGMVYLRHDATTIYGALLADVVLVTGMSLIGIFLGSILFSRLQKNITGPILAIVENMQTLSEKKDYSLRVPVIGEDELGILAKEFNAMIERLQERNAEIQANRVNLENLVQERTQQLIGVNKSLENELSERRRAEEELLKKSADLVKASQDLEHALKAEKRFVASMSHEMRTPLNAIIGFIEVLLTTRLDEYQTDLLSAVRMSSSHLLALICDVLDASKIESGQMALQLEPIDLKRVISECITLVASKVKKETGFSADIPDFEFSVLGDAVRLKQVFLNLLGNAAKFTDEGEILFRVQKMEDLSGGRVSLVFLIEDTGIGIPEEQLSNLFIPFRQLSPGREGTGLGLFISSSLVRMMGGKIEIANREEGGLRVLVSFVFEKKPSLKYVTGIQTVHAPQTEKRFRDLEVLIVEDLDVNIFVAKEILGRFFGITKYEIAKNGAEAVEKVAKRRFDLVFMDIQMPVMDGIIATRKIRETGATFPIIAMSANALHDEIEMAKAAGINDYITKPIKMESIATVLKAHFPDKEPG